jgi:hypothetical protein
VKFQQRWNYRQKRKDIPGMEEMLQPQWLNYWWHCWSNASAGTWRSNCWHAIERILQDMDLIGVRPPSPSERAMAVAEKLRSPS